MTSRTIASASLAAFLAACGGTIETLGDASHDTAADTTADTAADTWADPAEDTAADTAGDLPEEDTAPLACGDERAPAGGSPSPIVNGQPSWDPAVVALTDGQALAVGALMQSSGGEWTNICTATLIAPTLVLTAAHCVRSWTGDDQPASGFRFAVGADVSAPLHMWQPSIVQSNPEYSSWGGDAAGDVAVLVLAGPATVAVPQIVPIPRNCAALDAATFVGQRVQNVGYGLTETGWGAPDNTLRWWTVEEVIGLSASDITVDGGGVSAVCNGDSGGPSLWTMPDAVVRVVGTVSWGDPSCVDEDHFARTDYNCAFISTFEPADPCGGVTWEGACEGTDAVWCEGGAIERRRCADCLQACGWDASIGANYCIDP